ncbi:YeeE/YedE family protein [Catenovulum maritimum]|uniref:Sulphur transport domain-containing protein n=1 Tax=Catenovulum maritimum TaxID=1513271 RepID=A0A0J8GY88_9ALTE|nr:YeeE/YedE thiosulfate transporter family protein [Catenovulum maritimum]KMT65693.1 hypothetical protein XM47_08345 [Catenovulum maritimum]
MTEFTPISALIGGGLIGLASALLLLINGRIAGVSGMVSGLLKNANQNPSSLFFICGLVLAGFVLPMFGFELAASLEQNSVELILAGLLVGVGTVIGSGCTSGHGICGIGRFSRRSIVATCIFMLSAMITVYILRVI